MKNLYPRRLAEVLLNAFSPLGRAAPGELGMPETRRVELAIIVAVYLACCIWVAMRIQDLFLFENGRWDDPMLSSGFATALAAIGLSLWIERRYLRMINYLNQGHLIQDQSGSLHAIHQDILAFRGRLRLILPLAISAMMVPGFIFAFIRMSDADWNALEDAKQLEFFAGSVVLGVLAGHRLGTTAGLGGFAAFLARDGIRWRLVPGHPDKLGGVGSFGGYLAYQGFLCAIPLIWLTFWIVAGRFWYVEQYSQWTALHVGLWCIAAYVAYRGFYVPTRILSVRFATAKAELSNRFVPGLNAELQEAYRDLDAGATHDHAHAATDRISRAWLFRRAIEDLPAMAIGPVLTRLYNYGPLAVALPMVFEFAAGKLGGRIAKSITELASLIAD